MSIHSVTPQQANELRQRGARFIDIRESAEFMREHIPDAQSLPLSEINAGKQIDALSAEQTLVFYCQAGSRTRQNVEKLSQIAGQTQIVLLSGGISAWKSARLPTTEDKRQPLPVMRQVQIVAGSLILLGVVLGYSLHAVFFLLSGFVGAGLLFAGISGWCGMAILLAKMPWNRPQSPN